MTRPLRALTLNPTPRLGMSAGNSLLPEELAAEVLTSGLVTGVLQMAGPVTGVLQMAGDARAGLTTVRPTADLRAVPRTDAQTAERANPWAEPST